MVAMVDLATLLPFEYYKSLEIQNDISVFTFLETCKEKGRQLVLNKIFLLEPDVTRNDLDRVFDAHWHSGFMIRHLIYKNSRGDDKGESPKKVTPQSRK